MKRPLFSFLFCILTSTQICKAQSLSFQMNSFGNTPSMTISGLSFQFENISNCLFVGNGLAIYQSKNASVPFNLDCVIPISYEKNGLKIFPNPIGNRPKIQFIQKKQSATLFNIRIYNIEGMLVLEETKNGFELSSGVLLNTSRLIAGSYLVQVISPNSLDLLRIIKQD